MQHLPDNAKLPLTGAPRSATNAAVVGHTAASNLPPGGPISAAPRPGAARLVQGICCAPHLPVCAEGAAAVHASQAPACGRGVHCQLAAVLGAWQCGRAGRWAGASSPCCSPLPQPGSCRCLPLTFQCSSAGLGKITSNLPRHGVSAASAQARCQRLGLHMGPVLFQFPANFKTTSIKDKQAVSNIDKLRSLGEASVVLRVA